MKNKRKPAANVGGSHHEYVDFELTHPTAQEVCIAGSFNDWHPNATPMIRQDNGRWTIGLALPPGRYEYRFVVDGEWMDDPAAGELIPNPFGTANAVIEVQLHATEAPRIGRDRSKASTDSLPRLPSE